MSILSSIIFFDNKISESIFYLRSDFFDKLFLYITILGDWKFVVFIFIFVSVLFIIYRRKELIIPFFTLIIGSGLMTLLIKLIINRSRPNITLALIVEKLPSFPSAHSTFVFAIFGFFIYCIWRFRWSIILKYFLTISIIILILIVGFSRIYLGVHFLTDVIAGYLVGLLWVIVVMYISRSSFSIRK